MLLRRSTSRNTTDDGKTGDDLYELAQLHSLLGRLGVSAHDGGMSELAKKQL